MKIKSKFIRCSVRVSPCWSSWPSDWSYIISDNLISLSFNMFTVVCIVYFMSIYENKIIIRIYEYNAYKETNHCKSSYRDRPILWNSKHSPFHFNWINNPHQYYCVLF